MAAAAASSGIAGGCAREPQIERRAAPAASDRALLSPVQLVPQQGGWAACPFPPEADAAKVDSGVVRLIVTVGVDGRAQSVVLKDDPGYGFGRVAQECALRARYRPALDRDGKPIVASAPMTMRFSR